VLLSLAIIYLILYFCSRSRNVEIGNWKFETWHSCFCTVDERIQFWAEFHLSQISTFQFQVSSRERLLITNVDLLSKKYPAQVMWIFFYIKSLNNIIILIESKNKKSKKFGGDWFEK